MERVRQKFSTQDVRGTIPRRAFYDIDNEPIMLLKTVLDFILQQQNPANLISLYCFYYYTAKWKRTDDFKITTEYAAEGLGWHVTKLRKVKAELKKLGLIEDIVKKGIHNEIISHIVKINFTGMKNIENIEIENSEKSNNIKSFVKSSEDSEDLHPVRGRARAPLKVSSSPNKILEYIKKEKNSRKKTKKSDHQIAEPLIQKITSPNENIENRKDYEKYLPIAQNLAEIVRKKKNMKFPLTQIKAWTVQIRQLVDIHGVSEQRIRKALYWYRHNIGGQYVPVIESGKSLKEKFSKLEDAMERENFPIISKTQKKMSDGEYWYLQSDGFYYNSDNKRLQE